MFEPDSQSNTPPPFSTPEATLIGWNRVLFGPSHLVCLFPIDSARTVNEHKRFSECTQNGQLEEHEEKLAESDKKVYWTIIKDCTFNKTIFYGL